MGRPRKVPGGLSQTNIRMPDDLMEALDDEVAEYLAQHPGRVYTRSDLIREVLYAHVAARREKPKKGAKK
jgi:predicted DNA-binding protein